METKHTHTAEEIAGLYRQIDEMDTTICALRESKEATTRDALDLGAERDNLRAINADLLAELMRLVRALEPKEATGLDLPGIATLNAARAAIAKATSQS